MQRPVIEGQIPVLYLKPVLYPTHYFKISTCHTVQHDDPNKIFKFHNRLCYNMFSMFDPLMIDLRVKKMTTFCLYHQSVRSRVMLKMGLCLQIHVSLSVSMFC